MSKTQSLEIRTPLEISNPKTRYLVDVSKSKIFFVNLPRNSIMMASRAFRLMQIGHVTELFRLSAIFTLALSE